MEKKKLVGYLYNADYYRILFIGEQIFTYVILLSSHQNAGQIEGIVVSGSPFAMSLLFNE